VRLRREPDTVGIPYLYGMCRAYDGITTRSAFTRAPALHARKSTQMPLFHTGIWGGFFIERRRIRCRVARRGGMRKGESA
jgi:hypothetical protein